MLLLSHDGCFSLALWALKLLKTWTWKSFWDRNVCWLDACVDAQPGWRTELDRPHLSMASSAGSQGSDQHSGEEERGGEEAGQEKQRRPRTPQDPGQPEEVSLSAVHLLLFTVYCSDLNKASCPCPPPAAGLCLWPQTGRRRR